MIVARLFLLRMKSASNKSCREIHFMSSNFLSENRAVYEINMQKNMVEPDIRRMRFACCITKSTDIHTEYVILLPFFHGKSIT